MATALTVSRFAPGDEERWNALVDTAPRRHFFFRREYMTYHADRFTDFSLVVCAGDEPVALLPASIDGPAVTSHGGLTFGGLVAAPSLTARRTLDAFGRVLGFLGEQGVRTLVYKAMPHIYHVTPAEEDLYAAFRHDARLVRRDISSTVRPSDPRMITKGRRSAVAQGRRRGIRVEECRDFTTFMAIERDVLTARHGVAPAHTACELELLAARCPREISLTAAFAGDEMVAGVVVYETPVVAHAQYIAATAEGYEAHALDVVIDHLLSVRYHDKRYFDFGISTTRAGRYLNEGLIRNKESFGARATVYDTYELVVTG